MNVASQRAVRPSTSVSATGNAADFLPVTVKADRLVWPADDVACVVTASCHPLADQALELIKTRYADFGPTLAREKLEELHGLFLGKETVRRIMVGWLMGSRKQRPQPRYRRPCTGELIQIDGCDHDWFEGRGPACTALVYVDDATSKLMELLFVKSESTFSYFEATRRYIDKHGKPLALYSDKAGVFVLINTPQAETAYSVWAPCMN